MKTLTNVIVNNQNQDAIIEHYSIELKDANDKVIWVNEKDCIAKCRQDARSVFIYMIDQGATNTATIVEIRASSIKKLYEQIVEIEKQTSEEFID